MRPPLESRTANLVMMHGYIRFQMNVSKEFKKNIMNKLDNIFKLYREHLNAFAVATAIAVIALSTQPIFAADVANTTPQSSANNQQPIAVIKDFLQNTAPDKVDAAAK